uniref:Uncharacterized protein n=1 Tax=Anguilla anguilla TaxID=7936 RepID=A0A0E9VCR3_ANGAN
MQFHCWHPLLLWRRHYLQSPTIERLWYGSLDPRDCPHVCESV